ncbi:3'(2'),5'-bisphosphate nucleotidase CysQ [Halobacillus salinarum]|uniref:3'(2'),5'-bisphosphate nucleotidase CysQ n=1 Tax=Halobacillus salinarum TaxID=2932257 RepID=A0ABY4END6_9BACI|nr:3'(2'),5'-bisphosphate nucleotidase CysQ [Halobacillus salinarum]UOQ45709.1 3'(2'),5'-bisphosphate nucleotidase CysQ [Halobacillus salinarum]
MWKAVEAAYQAGVEIMKIYETEMEVEYKEDQSPLTIADKTSHSIIVQALKQMTPKWPVLSEEGSEITYEERAGWEDFWLVDPIDGTKEFIKKNGEFTVNIAHMKNNKPEAGIIYAPALDTLYYGDKQNGAFTLKQFSKHMGRLTSLDELLKQAEQLPASHKSTDKIRVVASRSHLSEETKAFIEELKSDGSIVETISAGSSLKLCLIAEGSADYYPRYAPTMEWDTGAGQAIVESAGGRVLTATEQEPLAYNKENLRNPWFLARR